MKSGAMAKSSVLALLSLRGALAAGQDPHPVANAITLIETLMGQVKTEGQTEEATFATFETWCKDSEVTLDTAIKDGKANIESLESEVSAKTMEKAALEKHIAFLDQDITKNDVSEQEATGMRDEANRLYLLADADYDTTITAIGEAITELEGAKATAEGAVLVQAKLHKLLQSPLVLEKLSEPQRSLLLARGVAHGKKTRQDPMDAILAKGKAAGEANTYDFKSDNIVDLLKELETKFKDDKEEATKTETAAQAEHDLTKNARDAALTAARDAKTEKGTVLGTVEIDLATAESSLQTAKDDLGADKTSFADMRKMCIMKTSEWKERSELREKELSAMGAAIKILAKVSGVRTEAPTNTVLPTAPTEADVLGGDGGAALVQSLPRHRGARRPQSQKDTRLKVVALLRAAAHKSGSHAFQLFAEKVATQAEQPFDQIINMIQKMIFQLMAEQKDEDEHKHWCDHEIEKTNASAVNKEEKITMLGVKIDFNKAKDALLAQEIADAAAMAEALTEHMNEATAIRTEGKKENTVAIKDAQAAQAALAQATSVLTSFYKESGAIQKEAWELLQKKARAPVTLPDNPATWDASYTGAADPTSPGTGIVAILEEVSSGFSRMEADTKAQEAMDQKAYDDDMQASDIERARRAKEAEMKGDEQSRLQQKTKALETAQHHTELELHSVETYMTDLEPACMDGDSTYEDRKAARQAEIDALHQAQGILTTAFEGGAPAPAPAAAAAFLARSARHGA